jgi:hypothetical protein
MNSANFVPDVPYRAYNDAEHELYLARPRHRVAREWAAHPDRSTQLEVQR